MRASDVGGEESYRKRETECESIQQRTGKQIKWNIHGAKLPPALATRVQKDIPRGEVICHVNPDIGGSEKTTKTEDEG